MSPALRPASRALALSARDRRIVARALDKLGPAPRDFGDALRALREAVEELIPSGRVFVLGATEAGPILGSIVSGVGIVDGAAGVSLVRVTSRGAVHLARLTSLHDLGEIK